MAAIGKQLKQSVKVFQSLMLYLRLPDHAAHQPRCGRGKSSERTFVVETVDSIDTSALVIPSKDEEVFRIFDLVRQQQANRFQRLLSSIDVIAQE